MAALTLATAGAAFGAENTDAANATTAGTASAASAVATVQVPKQRGLTRAEVRAQVVEARKNGTLIETEADMDVAQTRKHYAQ
ncbi:DUF4148 domain-containing protein [Pseudoduganella lutea]|uniref:DUF4148 domain-containing protein n=1 Tax=Pseudoduganella lutea TaxID=321985 RepID=A0A4P6L7Y7_9BURK|nr:DUF4148 domain-containing protein [Pseudoduganella lutea]